MANSSIIEKAKRKIIKEFITDDEIVTAIHASDVTKKEDLIGTHIFDYNQNPNQIQNIATFITVQVQIPRGISVAGATRVIPIVEVFIYSHQRHMAVPEIPKVIGNRNDYLSRLIDRKLNGRSDFGLGDMFLIENTEAAYQMDWMYRRMAFQCTEINMSQCFDE